MYLLGAGLLQLLLLPSGSGFHTPGGSSEVTSLLHNLIYRLMNGIAKSSGFKCYGGYVKPLSSGVLKEKRK